MEKKTHDWHGAPTGRDASSTGFRVTSAEKDRLEDLRHELRLTSRGQVVRVALDILERFVIAGAALGLPVDGKNWREVVDEMRYHGDRHQANNLESNGLPIAEQTEPVVAGAVAPDGKEGEIVA